MSNKYLDHVKAAGLTSGVRRGWHEATPSQRLVIGIGGSGGVMSAANLANNAANTAHAKKKNELEERSLKALQSINRKLTVAPAAVADVKTK